jgi:hypothetical protein
MIVVRDITRPLPKPKYGERLEDVQPFCSICKIQHFHKVYHLQLRAGSVIVSETIWEKLQQMVETAGFDFMNYVEDPPAQGINPGKETKLIEKYPINDTTPISRMARMAKLLRPDKPSKTARAGEE